MKRILFVVVALVAVSVQAQTPAEKQKYEEDYYRNLKDSPIGQKFRDTGQLGRLQQSDQKDLETAFAAAKLPKASTTNPLLTGCVVLMTRYDGVIMAKCAGVENKALGFEVDWQWPRGLSTKPGTQFYYAQLDKCRIVFSLGDVEDADGCNARLKSAPHCDQ